MPKQRYDRTLAGSGRRAGEQVEYNFICDHAQSGLDEIRSVLPESGTIRLALPRSRCAIALTVAIMASVLPGCDDDVPPPPEDFSKAGPTSAASSAPDMRHAASIHADRSFVIANMALVLQPDAAGEMGLTLLNVRPAEDGSSMTFGTFHRAASAEALVGKELLFSGGPRWLPGGSGIVTRFVTYKPHSAQLKITAIRDGEAEGTLSGEFYRFNAPQLPTTRGTAINLSVSFVARVVVR